jgi:methionyl-tRNA synthetase
MVRFIGLPARCEIRIFNVAGEEIVSLYHNERSAISSEEPWNLRSKENREVAPGLYFYYIHSDLGVKTGKLAIIK